MRDGRRRDGRREPDAGAARRSRPRTTLAAEGIELEVIDVRTISPLDMATISASVRRTGRLIVAHEANRTGRLGRRGRRPRRRRTTSTTSTRRSCGSRRRTRRSRSPTCSSAVLPQTEELVEAGQEAGPQLTRRSRRLLCYGACDGPRRDILEPAASPRRSTARHRTKRSCPGALGRRSTSRPTRGSIDSSRGWASPRRLRRPRTSPTDRREWAPARRSAPRFGGSAPRGETPPASRSSSAPSSPSSESSHSSRWSCSSAEPAAPAAGLSGLPAPAALRAMFCPSHRPER